VKTAENKIDFENSLAPWLGKTIKIVDYYLNEMLKQTGLDLSKEQMIVLKKLHETDGQNQNELAFITLRDKSSLARLLSKMERKKYILRKQDERDKRNNMVYLTVQGRQVFEQAKPVLRELIDTMEQDITIEQKQMMIQILKKIQFNFNQKNS